MFVRTLRQYLADEIKSTYTFKLYLPTQSNPWMGPRVLPQTSAQANSPREQIHNESCIWMKEEVEKVCEGIRIAVETAQEFGFMSKLILPGQSP